MSPLPRHPMTSPGCLLPSPWFLLQGHSLTSPTTRSVPPTHFPAPPAAALGRALCLTERDSGRATTANQKLGVVPSTCR